MYRKIIKLIRGKVLWESRITEVILITMQRWSEEKEKNKIDDKHNI